ncbi:MAG: nucleotide exchange factor GrpE [Patescibacteria group bacterium]|nr:nucleotide exchange factor GrpE [Patescibacteria group bacterium]
MTRTTKAEKKVINREKQLEENLKKALADFQNLQKGMEKRLDFERSLIKVEVMRGLVDLADDIDVAIDHIDDEKGWREGVGQILEKFRVVIGDLGAEIIKCKRGDKFDTNIHEAVGVVNKRPDGLIASVIQNGYKIEDVVVRPSRVIVNKIKKKK